MKTTCTTDWISRVETLARCHQEVVFLHYFRFKDFRRKIGNESHRKQWCVIGTNCICSTVGCNRSSPFYWSDNQRSSAKYNTKVSHDDVLFVNVRNTFWCNFTFSRLKTKCRPHVEHVWIRPFLNLSGEGRPFRYPKCISNLKDIRTCAKHARPYV